MAKRERRAALLAQFLRNRGAAVALLFLLLAATATLFAEWLAPMDPYAIDLSHSLQPPSALHRMGSDELGRDIWSRILYGGRLTFLSVIITAVLSAPFGFFVGLLSGYIGGWLDIAVCRIIDLFLAIPRLMLALVFVAILGAGLFNAAFAVALTAWPYYARVARSEVLALADAEFIQAAWLQRASHWRILTRYLMPLSAPTLLVRLSLELGGIILSIAAIGFLGLGAPPPAAEWGTMAAQGRNYLLEQWWVSLIPGLAIFSVSLSFNLIGEALRDLLDPKRLSRCL